MLAATFALFRPQRFAVAAGSERGVQSPARQSSMISRPRRRDDHVRPCIRMRAPSGPQFLHQLRFDAAGVLSSVPFLVLLAFGVAQSRHQLDLDR